MTRGLSFAYEGYNPGGPDGIVLDWFHDWIVTPDATTSTDWYVPLYIPRDRAEEWQMRFRRLSGAFHLSVDGFDFDYTLSMPRRFTGGDSVATETDLFRPGIIASDTYTLPADSPTVYSASQNDDGWNGPGSTLDLSLFVQLFGKSQRVVDGSPVDIPHMVFQQDQALIIPSVVITGSLVLSTPGTDYAFFFSNEAISSPAYISTVNVLNSHGGAGIALNFSSVTTDPSSFSLSFDPVEWFSWGGKWDTATGARL